MIKEALIIIPWGLALLSPFWIPMVFLAFAIGRRRFGIGFLFALLTVEAISIAFFVAVIRTQ